MSDQRYYISHGWDDQIETTALGFAAFHGDLSQVEQAILSKIDWSQEGSQPLHAGIFGRKVDCIEALLNAGSPVDGYSHYLLTKFLPSFYEKYFLKAGRSIDLQPQTATKCLVSACQAGSLKLCEYFLNAGADPNSQEDEELPIFVAARKLNQEMMELLLRHGALMNELGKGSHSALRVLADSGSHLDKEKRKEFFNYMVSRGAKAEPPFTEGESQLASEGEWVPICLPSKP